MRHPFHVARDNVRTTSTLGEDEPTSQHPFSADRPVTTVAADRLNRGGFAQAIASAISQWQGRDSLVIALYGPWGVGKTSMLNFIAADVKATTPEPIVVRFNPWEWSGHEELARALFGELEGSLRTSNDYRATIVAARLNTYAAILDVGGVLVDGFVRSVAAIGAALTVLGAGTAAVDVASTKWVGVGVALLGAVTTVSTHARSLMLSLAKALGRDTTERSLAEAKQGLSHALASLGRSVLIVIDDIDRLAPADAVRMLQVIKANADLPNLGIV